MSKANVFNLSQSTPLVAVREARGLPVRTVEYLAAGDPVEARVTRQCYTPSSQLLSQIDPRLFARIQAGEAVMSNFRYQHSLAGRPLRVEGVDNGLRLGLSDVVGRSHWSGDGRGAQQRWQYDALGRPLTRFERDATGVERCRERFVYGEGQPAAAAHNRRGQLWRHWDPAGERLVLGYSLQGQPLGEQRRFLLTLEEPDWPADEAAGEQLLEAEIAVTRWGYDALGEPLSQLDAAGHRRRSAFNRAGQLAGRWLTPTGQAETRVQGELGYNALGQLTTELAGNGVRTTRAYDPATQRLLRLTTQRQQDNHLLQDLHYDYDPVGNVLRIEDASQAVRHFRNQRIEAVSSYAYDSLYRLIEASGREAANAGQQGAALPPLQPLGDGNQVVHYRRTYHYDAADNLLSVQHQGAQPYRLDMTVSEHSNRALRSQAGLTAGDVEGGFDPNGNLRALPAGQVLQWEARNQLSRVCLLARSEAADDEERYGYDGAQQRVRKRRTLYGGRQTQVQETRYLPGLELHRSWQTDRGGQGRQTTEAYQVVSDGAVRWLHWEAGLPEGLSNDRYRYSLDDHLGSSALETDGQGQLLSREEYYPFGGTALWAGRNEVEASDKTLRYSGKERDATGLYYYGYRYYAPWLQRWLNPDPAGAVDGLNLYRMVRNNPLAFTDPSGQAPDDLDITLLYGFEGAREKFLSERENQNRGFVRIDSYNQALGIKLLFNYSGTVGRIAEGVEVSQEHVDEFRKVTGVNISDAQASKTLQSWSDFLKAKHEKIDIVNKLKKDRFKVSGKIAMNEFLTKNTTSKFKGEASTDNKWRQCAIKSLWGEGDGDPHDPIAVEARKSAYFRQISKLGLDWAADGGVKGVTFITYNPKTEREIEDESTVKAYKNQKDLFLGGGFEPITFSEYRYAKKNNYIGRTVKLYTYAP